MTRCRRPWQQPAKQQQLLADCARAEIVGQVAPRAQRAIALQQVIGTDATTLISQVLKRSLGGWIEQGVDGADGGGMAKCLAQAQLAGGGIAAAWQRDALGTRDHALTGGRQLGKHACPQIHG